MTYKRNVKKMIEKINLIYEENINLSIKEVSERFNSQDDIIDNLAMIKLAIAKEIGLIPYDEQMMCAIYLIHSHAVEMRTGEGKSLASLIASVFIGKTRRIYNVTVNEYLARRDFEKFENVYKKLGVTVGLNIDNMDEKDVVSIYSNNVIYTSSSALIFDYLSSVLNKTDFNTDFAILDEIDFILLDNANSSFSISKGQGEQSSYEIQIIKRVDSIFREMSSGEIPYRVDKINYDYLDSLDVDYVYERTSRKAVLTARGEQKLLDGLGMESLSDDVFVYGCIVSALEAYCFYRRNIEYMVVDGKVQIINEATGRIAHNSQIGDGIHPAIEAKEGLEINLLSKDSVTSSYQVFFSKFKELAGMSGTIMSDKAEFRILYKLNSIKVPLHNTDRSKRLGTIYFKKNSEKYNKTLEVTEERHKNGQPVLIVCSNERESNYVSNLLKDKGIEHKVLNNTYSKFETDIVNDAGKTYAVTVSTSMAGRGTDIVITEEANELGGLLVISLTNYESLRIENQIKGRAGRQGFRGEFLQISSLEDDIWKWLKLDEYNKIVKVDDEIFYSKKHQKLLDKRMKRLQKLAGMRRSSHRQLMFLTQSIIENFKLFIYNYYDELDSLEGFIEDVLDYEIDNNEFIKDIGIYLGVEFGEEIYKLPRKKKIKIVTKTILTHLEYHEKLYIDLIKTLYGNYTSMAWGDIEAQIDGIKLCVCKVANVKDPGTYNFIKQSRDVIDAYLKVVKFEILEKILRARVEGEKNWLT